jgi:two-component system sensor histidine kinase KdpD
MSFLAVAAVTTELLARARQEAAVAHERAGEVETLSRLGATTLRRVVPADALSDVARLVRETLDAETCSIFALGEDDTLSMAARSAYAYDSPSPDTSEERLAAERMISETRAAASDGAGQWLPFDPPIDGLQDGMRVSTPMIALPLRADDRAIGVMVVRGRAALSLDAEQRRFVFALAYYAALGVERMRLMTKAAQNVSLLEANRTKDEILASVSHDLRTPLTTIKVLAQGAESRGDPSAPAIVEQADRLERMVADLLELSRLRAGRYQATRELNTAEDVVGATLRRARGILGDRTIVPHIDMDAPALVGEFDFVDTLRILGNLLDNALRHSPRGGTVDLYVTRHDRWLEFIVADRGAGVDQLERERIFESFYRPSTARPDTGHAGLGLSIARTLAELQGGSLEFTPREGGGSVFTLRLPAADMPIESSAEAELD